jgi:ribosomal protein L40E
MNCVLCGADLPIEARFCPGCGRAIAEGEQGYTRPISQSAPPASTSDFAFVNCLKCGALVPTDARRCFKCGNALDPSRSQAQTAVVRKRLSPLEIVSIFVAGLSVIVFVVLTNSNSSSVVPNKTPTHTIRNVAAMKRATRPSVHPVARHTAMPVITKTDRPTSQPTDQPTSDVDPCDSAHQLESQAASAINSGENQRAYDLSVEGIAANDNCSSEDASLVNSGYLLSMKGLAEHYLPQGDSRTDLNQANQLLVECQTNPDLYGTATGASCETQEQNNISAQTNWDMGQ